MTRLITEIEIMSALQHSQKLIQKAKTEIRAALAGGSKEHIGECITKAIKANTHTIELFCMFGDNKLPDDLKRLNQDLRNLANVWGVQWV